MQQNLHVYDDHAGIIYLADGREVKFDRNCIPAPTGRTVKQ